MKNNAIARIIIFSIVIVLLLGILLTGLGIGMFMIDFGSGSNAYATVEDSQVQIEPGDIRNIEIEWAAGNIDIQVADTDHIIVEESGTFSDSQKMVMNSSGDTLTILYAKPAFQIGFFSYTDKDLTVTVPVGWVCDDFSLEVASAKMTFENFQANKVDIDTASGACTFLNCNIGALDVDTASGAIRYEGTLNSLDCDAASGTFEGIFTVAPQRIDMDSASGDLDITLPEGSGFRVTIDALSGKFQSDFPTNSYNGSYTYGDERCIINFDGASGSVKIHKAA